MFVVQDLQAQADSIVVEKRIKDLIEKYRVEVEFYRHDMPEGVDGRSYWYGYHAAMRTALMAAIADLRAAMA